MIKAMINALIRIAAILLIASASVAVIHVAKTSFGGFDTLAGSMIIFGASAAVVITTFCLMPAPSQPKE